MATRMDLKPTIGLMTLAGGLLLSSCGSMTSDEHVSVPVSSETRQSVVYEPFPLVDVASVAIKGAGLAQWRHYPLPSKQATSYRYEWVDGRHAMRATAAMSASMLRQSIRVAPAQLGVIKFSWKVPQLIAGADLTVREAHDSPVRLVLAFEGDRSKFSMKNAMISELALALTGEALPYATLMYVWCNACAQGVVLSNPRTDRIREIAMESGPDHLGQWRHYERDIRADYERAFGESPGALLDVGLMTDTDNTRETTMAWYGAVSLVD